MTIKEFLQTVKHRAIASYNVDDCYYWVFGVVDGKDENGYDILTVYHIVFDEDRDEYCMYLDYGSSYETEFFDLLIEDVECAYKNYVSDLSKDEISFILEHCDL